MMNRDTWDRWDEWALSRGFTHSNPQRVRFFHYIEQDNAMVRRAFELPDDADFFAWLDRESLWWALRGGD